MIFASFLNVHLPRRARQRRRQISDHAQRFSGIGWPRTAPWGNLPKRCILRLFSRWRISTYIPPQAHHTSHQITGSSRLSRRLAQSLLRKCEVTIFFGESRVFLDTGSIPRGASWAYIVKVSLKCFCSIFRQRYLGCASFAALLLRPSR